MELYKRFIVYIDKLSDIFRAISRLNKSFNAELAEQNAEIDVSDQIDEVVREIQAE